MSPLLRREHPANSLFRGARSLSPATTNLIAMKQVKKDRTAFSPENSDIFIKQSEICCNTRDEYEANVRSTFSKDHLNHFLSLLCSSIPMKYYDQDHCKRLKMLEMFRRQQKCRVLPLYGTLDLVTNDTLPVCRREQMWGMMPMMRNRTEDPMMDAMMSKAEAECPRDCWQEEIQAQMSFTELTTQNFENALTVWKDFPSFLTIEDVVSMELFFESLTAQVQD